MKDRGIFECNDILDYHLYGPQGVNGELYKAHQKHMQEEHDRRMKEPIPVQIDPLDEGGLASEPPVFFFGGMCAAYFASQSPKKDGEQ
jgi:hypothetical protein